MRRWLIGCSVLVLGTSGAAAQLDETCTVALQNRTAPVAEDGAWVIRNASGTEGPYRVRAICVDENGTRAGESALALFNSGESVRISDFSFAAQTPIPTELALSAPTTQLDAVGAQTQLEVLATYPDGSTADVASAAAGTSYRLSSETVAAVDADGLVTAQSSGALLVTARHEGAVGLIRIDVIASADGDSDGMPDDWEVANGLDPNNADDALGDADSDGLTNLLEFQTGTDPQNSDTDGDGLEDGEEVFVYGTNPLVADTDGDGVSDGLEVISGSDPNDAGSISLNGILDTMEVNPPAIEIIVNEVFLEGSGQLEVMGTLIDGTILDITSSNFGTNYQSSDLTVVNFGVDSGRLFGGDTGAATVTVSNSGMSVDVGTLVERFAPELLSFLSMPGKPQLVSLMGDHALVGLDASGAGGADLLQVVEVSNPVAPAIVGSLDVPELLAMEAEGIYAFLLTNVDLVVADVSDPFAPSIVTSVPLGAGITVGALELVEATLYLSTGNELVVFDVLDPAAPFEIGRSSLQDLHELEIDGDRLVALTSNRLQMLDATDPANAVVVGETTLRTDAILPSAADLAVVPGQAFVADGGMFRSPRWGGVRHVDLLEPVVPFLVGSTPDNLVMQIVETADGLVFAAGRQQTIRIFGVGAAEPDLRAVFFFTGPSSSVIARDLAVADGLMYLVGHSRVSSHKGLYISRYAKFEGDALGPPTVEITYPTSEDSILERRYFVVDLAASDDRRVASVALFQDGELVGETFGEPYLVPARAPFGPGEISLVAVATDNTGQQTVSEEVLVTIADDTDPVVRLLTPTSEDNPGEGSVIELVASASDDGVGNPSVDFSVNGSSVSTDTFPPYRTTYAIPVGASSLSILVTAEDGIGQIATDGPVTIAVLDDAPPSVGVVSPTDGVEIVEGLTLQVVVGASDDVEVSSVEIFVDAVSQGVFFEAPYLVPFDVPLGATSLAVGARAVDSFGQTTDATTHTVVVNPDPGTEVVGRVVDGAGVGLQGAVVSCLGVTGTSSPDGSFSVLDVPTSPGLVSCTATWDSGGGVLSGGSATAIPEVLGTTDVGDISVGNLVILAGYDPILAFIDETAGRLRVSEPFDDQGNVSGLVATPSGELFGTRFLSQVSTLWSLDLIDGVGPSDIGVITDATTGSAVPIGDLAIDPTTGRLYGLGDVTLYRIDTQTALATEITSFEQGARGVAFHPDGRFFVAGRFSFQDEEIREVDIESGSLVSTLQVTVPFVPLAMDIRPTDSAFVFSDGFAQLLLIDPVTGDALATTHATGPKGIVVIPELSGSLTTTVIGRAMRLPEEGGPAEPLAGELIVSGFQSAISAVDGTFSMTGVPATLGRVIATLDDSFVISAPATPIPNGVTDVGDIVVDEGPTQFGENE